MAEEQWILFDKAQPGTFPPDGAYVVVETESGKTFAARFVLMLKDFSLYHSLWGNQGPVVRWKFGQKP